MSRSAAELEVGQIGCVKRVADSGEVGRRILEMGVTPGINMRRVGAAPLGDPLEFEVRGYRLSLRKAEATQIEIED